MSEQLISTPSVFGENGNFLLERELGSGGMGGVYMGRDKMLDRPVAVKVMLKEMGSDPEFVEKFRKEAQSVARLIHPNIAQIYSYGISDGMPYMAMELATGGSLYSILSANPGKTDITRVLKICQQTAQALQCASDQGFVHGDVKPENILLDANGNAKLVDFGLAAMQKDTDEIWGTPYYISPEKVRKEEVDFRADIYSLGGTLYHALTGVAPFEGEDSIAVVKKRFEGMPKKPSEIRPEITPAIDELVMKMLAMEKDARYPSFESLIEAFRDVLTNGLTAASKTATGSVKRPLTGTRRMTTARMRRAALMKKSTSAAEADAGDDAGKVADETAADDETSKTSEDEEEEEGGNLGLKVAMAIIGGILAIGAVVGGLIWFKVSAAASEKREQEAQISASYNKAKAAIDDVVERAKKFADDFDAFAQQAVDACEQPTEELYKILPMEVSQQLKPKSSKELDAAIAATNETVQAAAPAAPAAAPAPAPAGTNAAPAAAAPAAPAPAGTNAAPAAAAPAKAAAAPASAGTNAAPAKAEAKKAEAPAKAAAAKAEEPAPPPEVVVKMNELWERAYGCLASAIRIRQMSREVIKKSAEADNYKEVTLANAEKLADLSRTLVDMLDQMKASKDVENVKKGITYIKSKGKTTVEQTVKRLRIEKLEKERADKAAKAAADEKARLEKAEKEKKEKIAEEIEAIQTKFDAIAAQGCFRQLDWTSAMRQLDSQAGEFTTAEGQLAAGIQKQKVEDMQKVHEVFIKSMNGFTFKKKGLKGMKVTGVDKREFKGTIGKSQKRVTWQKLYRDYPNNLNELINQYVVGGRRNARPALGLKDWASAMRGAALTLQIVCSEMQGAVEYAEKLAQDSVKEFAESRKTAEAIFTEIKFEASEE